MSSAGAVRSNGNHLAVSGVLAAAPSPETLERRQRPFDSAQREHIGGAAVRGDCPSVHRAGRWNSWSTEGDPLHGMNAKPGRTNGHRDAAGMTWSANRSIANGLPRVTGSRMFRLWPAIECRIMRRPERGFAPATVARVYRALRAVNRWAGW